MARQYIHNKEGHMQESRYHSRLREFRKEIRRNQIEQIKRNFRREAELNLMTVMDLAVMLQLPPREYSLAELVELRGKDLTFPPVGMRMEEQGVPLPMEAHINFWRFFSEQLDQDPTVWSEEIAGVLMTIVKKYTYQEVHHNVVYELHILNTLQLACRFLEKREKQRLLDWVAGPEGLRVIQACIGSQFLKCRQYQRAYRVIQLGLKSELRQENEDASAVLVKLLEMADWDDSYQIYQDFHGLALYLCTKIERYYKNGVTRPFTDPLILLLDTYDNVLIDYTRTGVGYSAALLVSSESQANRLEGITILRVLTQADQDKIIEELIQSKDIRACRLWERLFRSRDFSKNNNNCMREAYFSLLQNLLTHGKRHQIDELNQYFKGEYEDVFDLLAECLRDEENPLILKCALNSVKSLAYYGQREGEQNLLLPIMQQRQVMKQMEKLAGYEGQVGEIASELLSCLNNH